MPHGTGVNQALIAAINIRNFEDKVSRITALAPCLQMNLNGQLNGKLRDPLTILLFYSIMEEVGVTSLYGPDFETDILALCDVPTLGPFFCGQFFTPNPKVTDPYLYEESCKYYEHLF